MFTYNSNLHIHSTASDGVYTPARILKMAKEEGFRVIAITDHNEIKGSLEAIRLAKDYGIIVIPGIELYFRQGQKVVEVLAYFETGKQLTDFFTEFLSAAKFPPRFDLSEVLSLINKHNGAPAIPHPWGKTGLKDFPENMPRETRITNPKEKYILLSNADLHIFRSFFRKMTILKSNKIITIKSIINNLNGKEKSIEFVPIVDNVPTTHIILQKLICSYTVPSYLIRHFFRSLRDKRLSKNPTKII